MPNIGPLEPTSQLDAVNACLSAIGEAPVEDIDTSTRADVASAVQFLTEASKEIQMMGWRFNREYGYEVAPVGSLSWTDSAGDTTSLNVFLPPTGMLRWELTNSPAQSGLSAIIRAPRVYGGSAPYGVFYDRLLNRDGFDAETYEALYLDIVFYVEWAILPEVAKQHIIAVASRKFAARQHGSTDLVNYSGLDERQTLKALYADQSPEDEFNIFDSADVARVRAGRSPNVSGYASQRSSPRPT